MKIERMRKGQKLLNKMDGGIYLVKSVSQNEETGCVSDGVVVEVDSNNGIEVPESQVTVNEKNAICFRIIENVEPDVVDGYTLSNGILVDKAGKMVEQGELIVDRIVGFGPGTIILVARRNCDDNALYTYNTERDIFYRIIAIGELTSDLLFCQSKDKKASLIVWNNYEKVSEENNDEGENEMDADTDAKKEPEDCIKFKYSTIAIVKDFGRAYTTINNEEIVTLMADVKDSDHLFIAANKEGNCIIFCKREDSQGMLINNTDVKNVLSVTHCFFNGCTNDSLFIKAKDGLHFLGSERLMPSSICSVNIGTKLEGYDQLVDITQKERSLYYTVANEQYEVKTIVSTRTKDRGFIVKIID